MKEIIGAKIPIVVDVTDIGDVNLDDTSVGIVLTFWCETPEEHERTARKTYVIEKSDTDKLVKNPNGSANSYVAIVDTTNLDLGRMFVGVKITYTDADLGKQVVSNKPIETPYNIIKPY